MFIALRKRLAALTKNERGNVLILVGLIAFLLIMSVGVAVDMAREQILQQRISASLDSAGLAAMETIGSPGEGYTTGSGGTWVPEQANRYFKANFPTGYLGSAPITVGTSLTEPDEQTLSLNANTSQPTAFMQTFGVNTMSVGAKSQVTRSSNGTVIELVLVLDNTGSMACDVSNPNTAGLGCTVTSTSKITAVKTAAKELVSTLFGSGASNIYVGIVPFSQAVNITGASNTNWINPSDPNKNNFHNSAGYNGTWQGCVTARSAPYNATDDTPSTAPFDRYWYAPPTVAKNDYFDSTGTTPSDFDLLNYWRSNNPAPPPTHLYDFGNIPSYNVPRSPNLFCPFQAMVPMTSDQAVLNKAIDAMTTGGDTLIDQGLAWGWRMISPNWRTLWNSTDMLNNSLPNDYNANGVQKYILLITDGSNHFARGGYSAYGFLSQGQLEPAFTDDPATPTELLTAEEAVDANVINMCQTLGGDGVNIYTIGFGPDAPENPLSQSDRDAGYLDAVLLSQCASKANGVYYDAPNNAALTTAFGSFAKALENVRVSK